MRITILRIKSLTKSEEIICFFSLQSTASATTRIMTDANATSSQGSGENPARVAQRVAPLSITTSRPQIDGTLPGQYSYSADGAFAQPRSSPAQRTMSDPFPPPSPVQQGSPMRATSGEVPKSAGYMDSSVRFLKSSKGDKSPSSSRSDKRDKAKRRHSHESKINGYTECGRHGDDWLFGGFSVSDSVKKLLERDKKSG
jgi:hypothetical protein